TVAPNWCHSIKTFRKWHHNATPWCCGATCCNGVAPQHHAHSTAVLFYGAAIPSPGICSIVVLQSDAIVPATRPFRCLGAKFGAAVPKSAKQLVEFLNCDLLSLVFNLA
ncbi:hypothetical protein PanWU01x14_150780, partial [Parasponia andersonii]